MSQPATPAIDSQEIGRTLWKYRLRWIIPTVLFTAIAAVYAFVAPSQWQASQTLQVRDEAIGRALLGRFGEPESRKTAHETIVELAKGKKAAVDALTEVGPPANIEEPGEWPSIEAVESLQYAIEVTAPAGADLGNSDLIYVRVRDKDRQRAGLLTSAVCQSVDEQLRELRAGKYDGLANELQNAVVVARTDLDDATSRIAQIESQVGDDLSELRLLSESSSGESSLRQSLVQLETELRAARTRQQTRTSLLKSIDDAQTNGSAVPELSNEMVTLLPVLREMKTNLTAAQNRTALLRGQRTADHPAVKTALVAETQIYNQLQNELAASATALRGDLKIGSARIDALERHRGDITERMQALAKVRANYSNIAVEVGQRNVALAKAQEAFSQAQANARAAAASTLITMLDEPILSDRPVGLGKSVIILAGFAAGLFVGLGLVFLTAPHAVFVSDAVVADNHSQHIDDSYILRTSYAEPAQSSPSEQPERRPLSPSASDLAACLNAGLPNGERTDKAVHGYDRRIERTQKQYDRALHPGLSLREALVRIHTQAASAN